MEGYPYEEPSALPAIRALRKSPCGTMPPPPEAVLHDKLHGAWLGRIAGCMLGKPLEGIRTEELLPLLRETGNYPLHRYLLSSDITEERIARYQFPLRDKCYADTLTEAAADDDTNYTVLAQLLLEKHGRGFTPADVAALWCEKQPRSAYFTAERIAYMNYLNGYYPPDSAVWKNPFREWIGAQIRGDYYGYINPGDPEAAAELAWRDASISHVKNGIYGEMLVAAMLARAAVSNDREDILLAGLSQIPATSRLYAQLTAVYDDYKAGTPAEAVFAKIHADFDEHRGHHWCHTLSNARIVAAALLYGGGDFGSSVCLAVQAGFDTDCNGATVGSVLGLCLGAGKLDPAWTAVFHGKLATTLFGVGTVEVSTLAETTLRHCQQEKRT